MKKIIIIIFALPLLGFLLFYLLNYDSLRYNTDYHREDTLNWILTAKGAIYIKTYKSEEIHDSPNLVFVIHGDAPFNIKPGYQYLMAKNIAKQNKNTIAIGILRPGYEDPEGNISNGKKGLTTGDNYTPEVIEAIFEAISKLKEIYQPVKTIVIGHSGGAAIVGNLVGLKPGISTSAVLVSCPCNVPEWRSHMSSKQRFNPMWYFPVQSISPIEVAENINKETDILIITGENDDVTPLFLSEEYNQRLASLKKKSDFIPLPNEGHEILLDERVMDEIKNLLKQ